MRTFLLLSVLITASACRFDDVDTRWGVLVDNDGDGFLSDVDCDDDDAEVYPGAIEVCNGKDDNCDGQVDVDAVDAPTWYVDADGDGFGDPDAPTLTQCEQPEGYVANSDDCDDTNDAIFPGAEEIPEDGIDQSCSGHDAIWCTADADNDGFGASDGTQVISDVGTCVAEGFADNALDCDDNDDQVFPGAPELCDGVLNDCDASELPVVEIDDDGDGFVTCALDRDWAGAGTKQGGDCDDGNPHIFPGAPDRCDGFQNKCENWVAAGDPGVLRAEERDTDGDRYVACVFADGVTPENWGVTLDPELLGGGDCRPDDGLSHPNADEICDGVVNACGGSLPQDEQDVDGDGYVPCNVGEVRPWQGPVVKQGNDCDDDNFFVHPTAESRCDGHVNDCGDWEVPMVTPGDNLSDEEYDHDSDGYVECTLPGGFNIATDWGADPKPTGGSDCDPTNGFVFPGATSRCDGHVNDCNAWDVPMVTPGDNLSDDEYDDDGDGYVECDFPDGFDPLEDWGAAPIPEGGGDCDDGNVLVNPGMPELCDGIDNNCVNDVDDEFGKVTFIYGDEELDPEETWIDYSSSFPTSAPTDFGAPRTEVHFSDDFHGTLHVCGAHYRTTVTVASTDFAIEGHTFGASRPTFDGIDVTGETRVAHVLEYTGDGTLTVNNMRFIRGLRAANGGAIHLTGADQVVSFTDVTVRDSEATGTGGGGGIYFDGGSLTLEDAVFENNAAALGGGGLYVNTGTVSVVGASRFVGNNVKGVLGDGGAIYLLDGTLHIEDASFVDNGAGRSGGAIYQVDGTTTYSATNPASAIGACHAYIAETGAWVSGFRDNQASGDAGHGGGLIALASGAFTATGLCAVGNEATANDGGAILTHVGEAEISLTDSVLAQSAAVDWGGAIACHKECAIDATRVDFLDNTSAKGGAIFVNHDGGEETAILLTEDCLFRGNTATEVEPEEVQGGGAIACWRTCAISDVGSTFRRNEAQDGGAIVVYNAAAGSTINLDATLFEENVATDMGGAIACEGVCDIDATNGTSIEYNEALDFDGGGILLSASGSTLTLEDSSIHHNTAFDWGGGVACIGACTVEIIDGFVHDNKAQFGGAILSDSATSTVSCIATLAGAAGVHSNEAAPPNIGGDDLERRAGGVQFLNSPGSSVIMMTSSGCDWGDGETANTPSDFITPNISIPGQTNLDTLGIFECRRIGCDEPD